MLYHPRFCCHCGEKIVRATWTPLTSRRFCDFCAVEQKQHDLLPRATIIFSLLIGFAGLTTYFAGTGGSQLGMNLPNRTLKTSPTPGQEPATGKPRAPDNRRPEPIRSAHNSQGANAERPFIEQRESGGISSTEPVYYCGAITKKGTPCTRRVKTKGRCWQHAEPKSDRSAAND